MKLNVVLIIVVTLVAGVLVPSPALAHGPRLPAPLMDPYAFGGMYYHHLHVGPGPCLYGGIYGYPDDPWYPYGRTYYRARSRVLPFLFGAALGYAVGRDQHRVAPRAHRR